MIEDIKLTGRNINGVECENKNNTLHPETCTDQVKMSHESSDSLYKWITSPCSGSERILPLEVSLLQWLINNYSVNDLVDLTNYFNKTEINALLDEIRNTMASDENSGMMSEEDFTKLKNLVSNVKANWAQTDSGANDYILNKPTKLSDFINDLDLGVKIRVVESLPTGDDIDFSTIYLIPNEDEAQDNIYDEYIRIRDRSEAHEDYWELIGSTALDLESLFGDGIDYNSITKTASADGHSIKTTKQIKVSGWGGKVGSGTYTDEVSVINAGTSIEDILQNILFKLIHPKAATLPKITISVTQPAAKAFLGTSVTITAPSKNKSNGNFNADFTSPSQPSTGTRVWTDESLSATLNSGYTGYDNTDLENDQTVTVVLGENKITFSASGKCDAPNDGTNIVWPINNDGTQYISDPIDSTTWGSNTTITGTKVITTIGVYPCYTNISNGSLGSNANTEEQTSDNITFTFNNVPSEVVSGNAFIFEYPNDRTIDYFKVKDLSGNWVNVNTSTYTKDVPGSHTNYRKLYTIGTSGVVSYQIKLTKALNQ